MSLSYGCRLVGPAPETLSRRKRKAKQLLSDFLFISPVVTFPLHIPCRKRAPLPDAKGTET
jgi:hypothetical protein